MNASSIRVIASKTFFVLAVATLTATITTARPATKGSFNLTSEVRWGGTVLAPGHYTFTLDGVGNPYIITLHRGDDRGIFIMGVGASINPVKGPSTLTLVSTDSGDAVRTLRLANLNLTLSFGAPHRKRGEEVRKGSQPSKEIAVLTER